jgi:hypothetical protein
VLLVGVGETAGDDSGAPGAALPEAGVAGEGLADAEDSVSPLSYEIPQALESPTAASTASSRRDVCMELLSVTGGRVG